MNSRLSSPRAKTVTAKNGSPPSTPPGTSVVKVYSPSRSVLARPKPVNVCPSRRSEPDRCDDLPVGVGLPDLDQRVRHRRAGAVVTVPCSRTAPGVPGATRSRSPA